MDASESPGSTPSVIPGSVWVRTDGHRIAVDHVEDSSLVVWYERDPKINPGVRYEPNGGWYTTVSQMVKHVLPMERFRIRFSHVREGIDVLPLDAPSL
jgi:hypothetical protein